MLGVPQFGDVKVISNYGIVGTNSPGTSLPVNATTLLYGTVTQLISAANNVQDSWGIEIMVIETGASAAAGEASVDILIGGATDDVLIKALLVGGAYTASPRSYFFPVHIPGGVRIAAQIASVSTTISARILVTLYGGGAPPFRVGSKVVTYGTQINNARGQAVTPGASGATATATEMTASTSMEHFCFQPAFQISVDTTVAAHWTWLGIGVGAATEEKIHPGWWHSRSAAEHQFSTFPSMPAFRNVPAGSRLTLLASCAGPNESDQDALIYAVG